MQVLPSVFNLSSVGNEGGWITYLLITRRMPLFLILSNQLWPTVPCIINQTLCVRIGLCIQRKSPCVVWSATKCRNNLNLCTKSWILSFLPLLQSIQVILRSLLKSFFAFPVLSFHTLFILLKSVNPLPWINSATCFGSLVLALAATRFPKEGAALLL